MHMHDVHNIRCMSRNIINTARKLIKAYKLRTPNKNAYIIMYYPVPPHITIIIYNLLK